VQLEADNVTPANCHDWTATDYAVSENFNYGYPGGGSITWTNAGTDVTPMDCWNTPTAPTLRFYCLETDFTTTVTPPIAPGRLALVPRAASTANTGVATADMLCQHEATLASLPNASTFLALLATSTASAASRFPGTTPFVRTDGIPLVASGPDLFSASMASP